jgi:uncharacterized membrane protein
MKYRSIDKDIFAVIVLTIIIVVLAFTAPLSWVPVRTLTLPLVLVLPGYALTEAIFAERRLRDPERLVFSLGLSLIIVIASGFVINFTPFGLRVSSWAISLSAITLGACGAALLRRKRQSVSASGWLRTGNVGLTFRQVLLLGLAALIVCGAVVVSIIGAERQQYPGFTQFWILPATGATKAKNAVRLGVSNMESKAMQYRLIVNVDGKVIKQWASIDLEPNEKWEATLIIPQMEHTGTERVEALLYRMDTPTRIYRNVVLWLDT